MYRDSMGINRTTPGNVKLITIPIVLNWPISKVIPAPKSKPPRIIALTVAAVCQRVGGCLVRRLANVGINDESRIVLTKNQSVSKVGRVRATDIPRAVTTVIQKRPFQRVMEPGVISLVAREENAHSALSSVEMSAHIAITTKKMTNTGG